MTSGLLDNIIVDMQTKEMKDVHHGGGTCLKSLSKALLQCGIGDHISDVTLGFYDQYMCSDGLSAKHINYLC